MEFLKVILIMDSMNYTTAPCMYVEGAREMWLVMWLPVTVSRWQNALRDKRGSITALCDILKGSSL